MSKHSVNVPDYALRGRRKYTAGQFLGEFGMMAGPDDRRLFRFRHPVRVESALTETGERRVEKFNEEPHLFRHLAELAHTGALILSLRSREWLLGPRGVQTLNLALVTPAVRKGGLNIVRHFLENVKGLRTPIRGDFEALLSYLEIRPLPRVKPAKSAPVNQSKVSRSDSANAIHYVSSRIRHKGKGLREKNPRRHAKKA